MVLLIKYYVGGQNQRPRWAGHMASTGGREMGTDVW